MKLPSLSHDEDDLVNELVDKFHRVHLNTLQSTTSQRIRNQLWRQEIIEAFQDAQREPNDRDSVLVAHLFNRLLNEGTL